MPLASPVPSLAWGDKPFKISLMQHGRTPRDGLSVITKLPGADKLFVALSTPPAHVSTEPVRGLAQGGKAFQTHITPLFALLASFCVAGSTRSSTRELGRFARRELDCEYRYLIVDARYEKVRENAVIRSRAVLVAIGIDREGRRQVLGVEMANRESTTSWKDFLLGLKTRGLRGVIFVGSDDHPGLKRAIIEVLPEAMATLLRAFYAQRARHLPRKRRPAGGIALATSDATPPKPAEIWAWL